MGNSGVGIALQVRHKNQPQKKLHWKKLERSKVENVKKKKIWGNRAWICDRLEQLVGSERVECFLKWEECMGADNSWGPEANLDYPELIEALLSSQKPGT